jgi:branched-chain amino acid transport system permease protein
MNGAFYAMLSLGLAIIFGLLNIVNFAHGTFFMLGALAAWALQEYLHIGFWLSLVLAPLAVSLFGIAVERVFIRHLYALDHVYGLLLTFGLALLIQGLAFNGIGSSGLPYSVPELLQGAMEFDFMVIPNYRIFALVAALVMCIATWMVVERTSLGSRLRAATENPHLLLAFGVDVPRLITLAYAGGGALAGLAGVLAAPIYSVSPSMGDNFVIIAFAVVVIGGMGSLKGSIIAGLALGIIQSMTKVFYPQAASTVIFIVMALVILIRPAGLFGKQA